MTQAQATSSISAAIPRRPRAGRGRPAGLLPGLGGRALVVSRPPPCLGGEPVRRAGAGRRLQSLSGLVRQPGFLLLFIPMIDGFVESVVFAHVRREIRPALQPRSGPPVGDGLGPVLVALSACLIGSIVAMFAIAMVVVYVWWRWAGWTATCCSRRAYSRISASISPACTGTPRVISSQPSSVTSASSSMRMPMFQ